MIRADEFDEAGVFLRFPTKKEQRAAQRHCQATIRQVLKRKPKRPLLENDTMAILAAHTPSILTAKERQQAWSRMAKFLKTIEDAHKRAGKSKLVFKKRAPRSKGYGRELRNT